jgi:hypothetical protein
MIGIEEYLRNEVVLQIHKLCILFEGIGLSQFLSRLLLIVVVVFGRVEQKLMMMHQAVVVLIPNPL